MKVANQQSILDIAIQETGTVESVIDIAQRNSISITDDLEIGTVVATGPIINNAIAKYYAARSIRPATQVASTIELSIFDEVFDEIFE